jgi:hypothetical protein
MAYKFGWTNITFHYGFILHSNLIKSDTKQNAINPFPNTFHKTSVVATTRIWTHRWSDFIHRRTEKVSYKRANRTDPNEVKKPHAGIPKVSFIGLKRTVLTEAKSLLKIHGISVTNRPSHHNSLLCIPVGTTLQ